jgi:hypothetical protein
MRNKDKIERYLDRLVTIYGGSLIESEKSRYYGFNNHVLRVSDHIGSNSSGCLSIIVSKNGHTESYVIHAHTEGGIKVVTYEEAKNFAKNFAMMSSFVPDIMNPSFSFEVEKRDNISKDQVVTTLRNANDALRKENNRLKQVKSLPAPKDTILGVSKDLLTENQLSSVMSIVNKVKKENDI